MPDFSRVNPLKGFGNLFTKKKLLDTAKMLVMMVILFSIAAVILSNGLQTLASLILQPSASAIAHLVQWITGGIGLLLLVILMAAMVDVPLQSFLHKDQMKMSHQEVKEEGKESDGNPQMKGQMRKRQRNCLKRAASMRCPRRTLW